MNNSNIEQDNIQKIRKYRMFESDILNENIKEKIRITLFTAMQNGNVEVITIMDNQTFEYITGTDYNMHSVRIPYEVSKVLNNENSNRTYTIIHNHPSNCGFSVRDLKTFINYSRAQCSIICTNNCMRVAAMYKSSMSTNARLRLLDGIDTYAKQHGQIDDHGPAIKIIEYLEQRGLMYLVFKNY